MNFNNFWVVLIFVIIIILLLLNLFDVKIEFFDQAIDKVTDDIDFMSTGDGKIKGSSSILKDNIKIDHKVVDRSNDEVQNTNKSITDSTITNDNANDQLNKVINKSELNQDVTIIPEKPIDIELTTNNQETKDKVYENTTSETYKLKETGDKYVNLTDEEKAINEEMKKRFDNQEKEYKKAFKGKNELDYDGSVITDENIYQFGDFSYINANQLFIPTDYKTKEEDYGRNYIPPELWYKNNQRLNLPVCVPANGRCTVKDNLTSGYPLDVIEWHSSRKVMNPDGINQEYINEKLNTNSDIGSIKEIVREVIKETKESETKQ